MSLALVKESFFVHDDVLPFAILVALQRLDLRFFVLFCAFIVYGA